MKHHERAIVRQLEKMETIDKAIVGAEIGVWRGHFSASLLGRFSNLVLSMVDPWDDEVPYLSDSVRETEKAYQNALDATAFASARRAIIPVTSLEASVLFEEGELDFVFIDGLHDYDNVEQDIRLWYPKVRSGGLISGHDYGGKLDRKGVNGVKKAVDEFVKREGLELGVNRITWWSWKP